MTGQVGYSCSGGKSAYLIFAVPVFFNIFWKFIKGLIGGKIGSEPRGG
jgi:hypothetical protein